MRVLSGIQPTGRFHWGNYFGAIQQYISLQGDPENAFYFIADLHALTTVRDAEQMRNNVMNAALDLLALGLKPEKATLFVQSEVPQVTQLSWLLTTITPIGMMQRCHAYKEKKARGLTADLGLFSYPVLMAADILVYDSDLVPVGEDQNQHIEVARDLAGSFNTLFGNVFILPKAKIMDLSAKVPGTDGEKMSKSYGNVIECFEEPKAMRKKIMRIETDCRPMEDPKDPDTDHLYQLYSNFATPVEREEMAALYRKGGFGYGLVKKALADKADEFFSGARELRAKLENDPDYVRDVLDQGAKRASEKAAEVLDRAMSACGLRMPKSV